MASYLQPITYGVGLSAIVMAGSVAILLTVSESASVAALLLAVVASLGLYLCHLTRTAMDDPDLARLGGLWLLKLALTLGLLYAGWIPELYDQNSASWGYDPQRYFSQAYEFATDGWSPDLLAINYLGVLYYYGAAFVVFGHNPVVPALLNALFTLVATLLLVRASGDMVPGRVPTRWVLGLAMLLPEVLWFDALTSREGLLAVLIILTLVTAGRFFARTNSMPALGVLFITMLGLMAIAAIRTSILPPMLLAIILMAVFVTRTSSSRWLVWLALPILTVPFFATDLISRVAGIDFDWWQLVQTTTGAAENIASSEEVQWSQNSIGMLLMPESALQAILFLPLRAILYLLAPLPNVPFTIADLAASRWSAWQGLAMFLSALINAVIFPRAMASLIQAWKERHRNRAALLFHIPYWVTFAAIAGGNLIIHERYRVMVAALLWSCAWLSVHNCPPALVRKTTLAWISVLAAGAFFYGLVKLVGI